MKKVRSNDRHREWKVIDKAKAIGKSVYRQLWHGPAGSRVRARIDSASEALRLTPDLLLHPCNELGRLQAALRSRTTQGVMQLEHDNRQPDPGAHELS